MTYFVSDGTQNLISVDQSTKHALYSCNLQAGIKVVICAVVVPDLSSVRTLLSIVCKFLELYALMLFC